MPQRHKRLDNIVSKTIDHSLKLYKVYKAARGDLPSQISLVKDIYNNSMGKGKRKTGTPKKKRSFRRKPRYFNNYLRPVRIPFRCSIPWARTKGTTGKWSMAITLNELIKGFTNTYDEFKVARLTVRWLPNNSTSSSGLCAAVLMDQDGFGEFGSAAASAWFTTISSMPGSYVGNRHSTFSLRWRPTEPASREWRSYQRSQTTYVICHFYMADNGAEDSETGGIILVSGTGFGRGMYYNAATTARLVRSMEEFEIVSP